MKTAIDSTDNRAIDVTKRDSERVLVLVSDTDTADETAEYALREARDATAERETATVLDIANIGEAPADWDSQLRAGLADERPPDQPIEFGTLPEEPLGDLARRRRVATADRIVLDPSLDLPAGALRDALGVASDRVEVAPVDVRVERRRLLQPTSASRLVAVFGMTFLFYLAIGGFAGTFDVVTGAISASVVTVALSHVAFRRDPALGRTGARLGRLPVYLPVLCWEIVKSNVAIAYVILHPDLPIDPAVKRVEARTESGMEQLLLANSIALTPGTLVIDVRDDEFHVHELTAGATEALASGPLIRGVRYVFHGHDEREPIREVREPDRSIDGVSEP